MLAALAITGLGAAVAVLWSLVQVKEMRAERDHYRTECRLLKEAVSQHQAKGRDDRDRYESVVIQLKNEIADLHGDLDACTDPEVVRDRLQRLLSRAAAATTRHGAVPRALPGRGPYR